MRREIAAEMTDSEIGQAQRAARDWLKSQRRAPAIRPATARRRLSPSPSRPPRDLRDGVRDAREDIVPVAFGRLAKQARRRIPRAIVAPEQPAPVGNAPQRDVGRLAERAARGARSSNPTRRPGRDSATSAAVSRKASVAGVGDIEHLFDPRRRTATVAICSAPGRFCSEISRTPGTSASGANAASGIERPLSCTKVGLPCHEMPTLKPGPRRALQAARRAASARQIRDRRRNRVGRHADSARRRSPACPSATGRARRVRRCR